MNITSPKLTLTFMGNDLPAGHSSSQVITDSYIIGNSIRRNMTLMSGLKSASNQITLSISKKSTSVEDIISTDGDIKAVLTDGTTTIFTGYISTSFSWKVTKNGEQVLSITIEDTSTRLLSKPFIETGYHLFNSSAADAIDAICDAAGITISNYAVTIMDNITYVAEAGQTCKQLLDQMLYELGYVYYCDNLGQLNFFEIDVTSLSGIPTLDKDDLYEKSGNVVSLSKKIRQYRSVRMTYTAIGGADNYLVYRNTTGQNADHPYCNMELQSGEHFDGLEIYTSAEWAEETADEFREPALVEACNAASETNIVGSNKIISISSLTPVVEKGSNITVTMTSAGGPYIEINAQNNGVSAETVSRMDLYASILYEKSNNIVRTGISGGTTDSLYTEDCEFIHTKALMTRHANLVCQYNAYCNSRYTFYSDANLSCGSLIHLNENVFSGLAVDVMIIGKSETDTSSVTQYTAIGVSVFSLDDDVYHRDTDGGKADTKGERGASSRWAQGTALTGTSFARGVAGNEGDYYLNLETYNIYRCIISGGTNTAYWQYAGNIKGQDASVLGFTYEVEYGLSSSDSSFVFPDATYGYDTLHSYGYDTDNDYGFENYAWSETLEGWYDGLFVWTRIKITDADGNITYQEPTFSQELTQSLEDSCSLELSSLPDAYTSNLRNTGYQYLNLTLKDIGYKGTLILRTDAGVFASYNASTEEWTDLTNALTIILDGTTLLTDYGIKLPYAYDANVTIAGDFEEWTLDTFSIQSLSICPSILKNPVVQLETVDTFADLPTHVNVSSQDASTNDNLIKGDYILVKYLTLTAANSTQAQDETGKVWNISELSSYYDTDLEQITISAFVTGNTYYAFAIYAWMYDGTQWSRSVTSAVEINTVKEAVDLAETQHDLDPTVDYHRCLYAHQILVQKLTAGVINVGNIFVNDITSNNYEEAVDGTPTKGYKLEYEGGEDENGQIKSVGGLFSNMNVRGSLKLWKDDLEEVGADIEHPALTTVSETIKADPTGVSVANSPVAWSSDSLLSQVGNLAKNNIATAGGSFKSKTLAYYVYADNLATLIRAATTDTVDEYRVKTVQYIVPNYYKRGVSVNLSVVFNSGGYNGKSNEFVSINGTVIASHYGNYGNYGHTFTLNNISLNGGDIITAYCEYPDFPSQTMYRITVTVPYQNGCYLSDYVSSTGFWLEYDDGTMERFPSGQYYTDRMQMSSPVSFDSNSYLTLNNCSNFLNYWTFTDSDSVSHTLKSGITYAITSTNLFVLGNLVTGKYFTRNASSVVIYYEYNSTTYSLEIVSGGYYQAYGTIKIAQTDTKGVKMMGCYPKRDADDPDGGFDCGNSSYVWENGYFKTIHYQNVGGGSARALKENIVPFTTNALSLINSTQIVNFNYKKDKNKTLKIGFIADDTPEELSGKEHDKMELDHCVAVLIKAVQELSAEIDRLKGGNA